jgi:hypothetical protein
MLNSVYNDADFLSVYKQKRMLWSIFVCISLLYLGFCIGWLVYFIGLPYKHEMQYLPKLCVFVATAIYVIFCYLFLGIKYSRVRRYYKTMYFMSLGLKSVEKNYFYCFDEKVLQKETIDVHSCIFEVWDRKHKEWLEREVYCDPEKPLPPFEEGDEILYVTQSSYLLQYEIKQKNAVEFEEVEE